VSIPSLATMRKSLNQQQYLSMYTFVILILFHVIVRKHCSWKTSQPVTEFGL